MAEAPSSQAARTRVAVLVSLVVVIIAALPVWWHTTTITRLPLPGQPLHAWEDRGACPIRAAVRVALTPQGVSVGGDVCRALEQRLAALDPEDTACLDWHVEADACTADTSSTDAPRTSHAAAAYTIPLYLQSACNDTLLAACVPDDASVDTVAEAVAAQLAPLPMDAQASHDLARIQYAKVVRVVFSLLNEDASQGGAASGWDLQQALAMLERFEGALPPGLAPLAPLARLLRALRDVYDVQLESQVQWYAPLEFVPTAEVVAVEASDDALGDKAASEVETTAVPEAERVPESVGASVEAATGPAGPVASAAPVSPRVEHFASLDDVRVFINAAQWSLESYGLADAPSNATAHAQFAEQTLHLVLFLPSDAHRPLRIRDPATHATIANPAWLVPQWGGVVIWNRAASDNGLAPPLSLEELAEPLRLFTAQLAQLLGIAEPHLVGSETALYLAVQGLLWRRTLESVRNTVETLSSTVRLVDKIPNLGVDTTVRDEFTRALELLGELDQAVHNATRGTSFPEALDTAFAAQMHASRAFFDPSMLAMLYFPDEHKYAVYTPLFGPLFVPLVVAIVREDLARVLALSMHDSPHPVAGTGEHASPPRRSPRRAAAARSPAAQAHASPSAASPARRSAVAGAPSPAVVEDVFQSRSIPPEARTRSQRGTPSKKRTRDRDAMRIGSDVFASEPAEPGRSPAPKKGKRGRAAEKTAHGSQEPDVPAPETLGPAPPADAAPGSDGPQSNGPTDSALGPGAPETTEDQASGSATSSPVPPPAAEPAAHAATQASEAAGAAQTPQPMPRGASPTGTLSTQEARRRLFGKPLPTLLAQRKAAPTTSRSAGLQRTTRVPPLHVNRKPPPPPKPRPVSSKPKEDEPVGSDEEEREPEPEIDYENEGFL
ncbi:hypothetical protein MBRA1_002417 [Malassezia brasiliensis]|uniref:GPI transamidase component PIG-S n=1 Tax=Malassezia brasiliensis TaxID=1821822 RepID=A0AAF0ITC2_9BASI|nr:hypothetical protein MBRA1_002417 [Malassezia brasiliensis]